MRGQPAIEAQYLFYGNWIFSRTEDWRRRANPCRVREYSRLTDELTREKNRLANRIRQQSGAIIRRSPSSTRTCPSGFSMYGKPLRTPPRPPASPKRTVSSILKKRRIRRIGADEVLGILRTQPLSVAPGVTDAAKAHIRLLAERLRLVNKQIKEAHGQLDRLGAVLAAPAQDGEAEPGSPKGSATRRSSTPCQASPGSAAPRCLQKPPKPCGCEITTLCAFGAAKPR